MSGWCEYDPETDTIYPMDESTCKAKERQTMDAINLVAFARKVHENAVAHGWWEGKRDMAEVKALIHSEWTEALEEARAGRPMVWHMCPYTKGDYGKQAVHENDDVHCEACTPEMRKPEGIAVELIDGVIRILDVMAQMFTGDDHEWWKVFEYAKAEACDRARWDYQINVRAAKVSTIVNVLHDYTSDAVGAEVAENFGIAVGIAFEWIKAHGINPEEVMVQKNEYNLTRTYKHGKLF